MTNASKTMTNTSASQKATLSAYPVSFGSQRYDLLHHANHIIRRQILQDQIIPHAKEKWDCEALLFLLKEFETDKSRNCSKGFSLSESFYEVSLYNSLKDEKLTSERDSEILYAITHAKKNALVLNSEGPRRANFSSRNSYSPREMRELGKSAIALATGGAALGAIVANIPGAIIGGCLGVFVTFSKNKKRRFKGG